MVCAGSGNAGGDGAFIEGFGLRTGGLLDGKEDYEGRQAGVSSSQWRN